MANQDSKGFFERLTGARIMERDDDEETDVETTNEAEPRLEDNSQDEEQYLEEAVDEVEVEDEESYSDEDTGTEESDSEDEQEGQLTVDVFQDDSNVVVQSTIAGVAPENLDVSITNDMITIRGERSRTHDVDTEDYFYQECYWGTFSRSIILPVEIDADRAEAKIKNGILTIRIPKANAAMTRKLKVSAN